MHNRGLAVECLSPLDMVFVVINAASAVEIEKSTAGRLPIVLGSIGKDNPVLVVSRRR
jgi:hypothetical protein